VALLLDSETFFNTNYPAGSQKNGFIGTGIPVSLTGIGGKRIIVACAHLIIPFILWKTFRPYGYWCKVPWI